MWIIPGRAFFDPIPTRVIFDGLPFAQVVAFAWMPKWRAGASLSVWTSDRAMILEIRVGSLEHKGYATPLATLQTALWTGLQECPDTYFDCFTPEIKEQFQDARAKAAEQARCGSASPECSCNPGCEQLQRVRVYAQHVISDNEVQLEYALDIGSGAGTRCKQRFRRLGEAWKISGPPQEV